MSIEVCGVCGVKIEKMLGGDRVLFAYGKPGTREILWQRVCKHVQKEDCLNKDGSAQD
ncbi:hypothetical protein [Roseofilum casamattae]|uniref:Uncharacterized protein n=1 Tax=Roseofilum casamattae BLCC-M143 TaxID=3022442 RepID=A0ABT7BTW5_9CYAN|nr:hypothetical protein [Roseofilum casamattae]MDJ1182625.1 hypothetical protein [Roseofilum casamattae BLCC-M143]